MSSDPWEIRISPTEITGDPITLTDREVLALVARIDCGDHTASYEEAARLVGVSKERMRQIQSKTVSRLRGRFGEIKRKAGA